MSRLKLLVLWAARDLLRRPGAAVLSGLSLAVLVTTVGTALLLTEAVSRTAVEVVEAGPSVVARRLGQAGVVPMPMDAVERIKEVPGVLRPRVRLWGTALVFNMMMERMPVSILATSAEELAKLPSIRTATIAPGQIITGPGMMVEEEAWVTITGPGGVARVEVMEVIPSDTGALFYDTFLMHPDDVRLLLDFGPDEGADLAFDVFRSSEEEAIRNDLAEALAFPVMVTIKKEAARFYRAQSGKQGSLLTLLALPALLAIGALMLGLSRAGPERARELGLMKSMGWTTADLMALATARALITALPSLALGLAGAWAFVYSPLSVWAGTALMGWSGVGPQLRLDPGGAGFVMAEVAAFVLLPWMLSALWPAVQSSSKDPWELMGGASD